MATRKIPWARVLVEGVAIVASILLAFGIQALWEERQERSAERVYLTQLRDDLGNAEKRLADAAATQESAAQSVLMVIAASQKAEPPPNDSLVAWLGAVGFYQEGVPTLSTAQGLLASDALRSIETAEVRTGLINLLDQLRQMEQRQLMHEELFMEGLFRLNRIVPALSRGMPRYVGLLGGSMGGASPDALTRDTRVEPTVAVDLRPMLRDPSFLSAVDELWISHENLRSYIQAMLNETRAFLGVLDEVLGPSP